MLLNIFMNI